MFGTRCWCFLFWHRVLSVWLRCWGSPHLVQILTRALRDPALLGQSHPRFATERDSPLCGQRVCLGLARRRERLTGADAIHSPMSTQRVVNVSESPKFRNKASAFWSFREASWRPPSTCGTGFIPPSMPTRWMTVKLSIAQATPAERTGFTRLTSQGTV